MTVAVILIFQRTLLAISSYYQDYRLFTFYWPITAMNVIKCAMIILAVEIDVLKKISMIFVHFS